VDWYTGANVGQGTATNNGGQNSAVISLHYAYTLEKSSKLMMLMQDKVKSKYYHDRAQTIKKSVCNLCFDKKIFSEQPSKDIFDQHTNIMAILTDAIPVSEQRELLKTILAD
jgi:alpha-L-rhamnosidase